MYTYRVMSEDGSRVLPITYPTAAQAYAAAADWSIIQERGYTVATFVAGRLFRAVTIDHYPADLERVAEVFGVEVTV